MSERRNEVTSGGFVVAMDRRAERAELGRILSLPEPERERELERRARAQEERAADYARREVDRLLAHDP